MVDGPSEIGIHYCKHAAMRRRQKRAWPELLDRLQCIKAALNAEACAVVPSVTITMVVASG